MWRRSVSAARRSTRASTRAVRPADDRHLEHRGDAALAKTSASVRTRSARLVGQVVAAGVERRRRSSRRTRSAPPPAPGRRGAAAPAPRAGSATRRRPGCGRPMPPRVDHRRHADARAAPAGWPRARCGARRAPRRRRARSGRPVEGRAALEQSLDVVGGVGDDVLAPQRRPGACDLGPCRARCGVRPAAGTAPPAPRPAATRRGAPRRGVRRCARRRASAPSSTAWSRVEQGLVGAPVDAERLGGARPSSAAAR